MIRTLAVALSLTVATVAGTAAFATDAPALSVETSLIGAMMDNAAAKAILDKHLPGLTTNPQIEMARSMTLKQIQGFAPDQLTDEALAKVQADLAALPAAK